MSARAPQLDAEAAGGKARGIYGLFEGTHRLGALRAGILSTLFEQSPNTDAPRRPCHPARLRNWSKSYRTENIGASEFSGYKAGAANNQEGTGRELRNLLSAGFAAQLDRMGQCRFCGAWGPLVKAHVIPEAFFRPLQSQKEAPLLVAGAQGVLPKRAPIGVYDRGILCLSCEAKFAPADSYGTDILLTRFSGQFQPLQNGGRTVAYEAGSVDKLRLLEFLIAVLWRASVSSENFFSTVQLGAHEFEAKGCLFQSPATIPPLFDAVLSRWSEEDGDETPTTALLNPHRETWSGVNAYRLYLGRVVAYVRVDKRPFEPPFSTLSLQSSGPCRIVARELSRSKDIEVMRKTVRIAEANRAALKAGRGKS